MPDLALVTTILTSIKTATDIAKALREADLSLEKAELKLKLADLMTALADARVAISSVQEELLKKEKQIKELQESLDMRKSVKYRAPFYWVEANQGREGPFCQQCYDSQRKLIRLQETGNVWICKTCGNHYVASGGRSRQVEVVTDFDPMTS